MKINQDSDYDTATLTGIDWKYIERMVGFCFLQDESIFKVVTSLVEDKNDDSVAYYTKLYQKFEEQSRFSYAELRESEDIDFVYQIGVYFETNEPILTFRESKKGIEKHNKLLAEIGSKKRFNYPEYLFLKREILPKRLKQEQ